MWSHTLAILLIPSILTPMTLMLSHCPLSSSTSCWWTIGMWMTVYNHWTNFATVMRFAYIGKLPKAIPVPKNTNETRTTHNFLQHQTHTITTIIMKGTKVLTLSAHNLEKMMTTQYHQHSYFSSSVPVSQLMHSCTIPTALAFEMNFEL